MIKNILITVLFVLLGIQGIRLEVLGTELGKVAKVVLELSKANVETTKIFQMYVDYQDRVTQDLTKRINLLENK